jgi:hypothetical protein
MEDVIAAVGGTLRDGEIGQIAFEKVDAFQVIEVAATAGDQVIDNANRIAAAKQFFRKMRSDEAGAAGHEVMSHAPANLSNIRARGTAGA